MTTKRKRKLIKGRNLETIDGVKPLDGVPGIVGARIYNVGQGDGIAIMSLERRPVLHIDYGGRQGNPFAQLPRSAIAAAVDALMPIDRSRFVMITHWDQDHWCSAEKGR